ncbi:hypothetical protein CEXT_735341 [Caerostris extrusa]|uniref:Uncharacterized protein n=1 Tax=Caerostris extrusa TaxID=172846 RepID=A0AAV4Y9J7_CAEEX|nr:hypothetical protein CEXT_735341 [Caerostris extrusa]
MTQILNVFYHRRKNATSDYYTNCGDNALSILIMDTTPFLLPAIAWFGVTSNNNLITGCAEARGVDSPSSEQCNYFARRTLAFRHVQPWRGVAEEPALCTGIRLGRPFLSSATLQGEAGHPGHFSDEHVPRGEAQGDGGVGRRGACTLHRACTTRAGRWTSPPATGTGPNTVCWQDWQLRLVSTMCTMNPGLTFTLVLNQNLQMDPDLEVAFSGNTTIYTRRDKNECLSYEPAKWCYPYLQMED